MAELVLERETPRHVCCIGDIHGYYQKLQNLWKNLETHLGFPAFERSLIIFLGDYCDRGPETSKVLDFLLSLPSLYPNQTHVYLCGNHDLSFAAFIGVLPRPPNGHGFELTWSEYLPYEEREGWYKGPGYESMHVQGRRWGGVIKEMFNLKKGTEYKGSIYDAGPTFESYGVPHGHHDLVKAVPEAHKKFLADLVWVHEEENACIDSSDGSSHGLIAVHAGLEKGREVGDQLKLLRSRGTSLPKVEHLSGRKNVWDLPEELLEKKTFLVSGHHGTLHIDGLRLIIDESGGLENLPLAAVVLPSMKVVRDTDVLVN
ncbi:hypothetical protein AMTRI_Chr11g150480 [Amborella trichopoda]